MDTLRYLDYVKESGTVIINTEKIYPPAVNLGESPYPANAAETVRLFITKVVPIDAVALALRAGNIRAVNTVLLGALSTCLNLSLGLWEKVLQESFPTKLFGANREAFRVGRGV